MAETVSTGGNVSFNYQGENPKLSGTEKQGIKEAYVEADDRKRKSRVRKIIAAVTLLIIIAIILGTIFLR